MTTPLEAIEAEALKLAPYERSVLAERLFASVGEDIEHAWAIELAIRDADADANPSSLIPADEAIAEARRAIV